jgi:phage-related minor tail protein
MDDPHYISYAAKCLSKIDRDLGVAVLQKVLEMDDSTWSPWVAFELNELAEGAGITVEVLVAGARAKLDSSAAAAQ